MNKNKTSITTEKAADAAAMSMYDGHRSPFEEWSTAGIGNAFLFGKVMTANPDLLLELLQYSLPEFRIQKINDVQKEVDVKLSIDSHGVRLDILTSDDRGRQIDVEMQMQDERNIPHRMRYYGGSIDQTLLEKGTDYNQLSEMVILFITPFDPFDARGYYKYTFRSICLEDRELELQDGVTKVVLNAKGRIGKIPPELQDFLQLVASTGDSGSFAAGSFADRVQRQVHIARRNARWRKEYMDWEMTLRHERQKGLEEGLEKGRAEGLAEGHAKGIAEGHTEGIAEGRAEERVNTERERKRADEQQARADSLENEIEALRKLLQEHGIRYLK